MEVDEVKRALSEFIASYRTEFSRLANRQSQLLEMGALALTAEHYRINGYAVEPRNLRRGSFKIKLGSRGYPWNFSWFKCVRGEREFVIHANVPVFSNYRKDEGRYVVDVGVLDVDGVPRSDSDEEWVAAENEELWTFLEAKRLVVYPVLLAQFVGIVHEVKPRFLGGRRPYGFCVGGHFDPALVAVGYLHATARKVESSYADRGFKIQIVPAFDTRISELRGGHTSRSPLSNC